MQMTTTLKQLNFIMKGEMLISDSIRKSIRWLMYDNMLNAKLFHSFFLNEL